MCASEHAFYFTGSNLLTREIKLKLLQPLSSHQLLHNKTFGQPMCLLHHRKLAYATLSVFSFILCQIADVCTSKLK